MQLAPGASIAERYALERVLASGGMGVVWLARHVELGQPVALKFLHPELARNAALVGRFLEEARAAAALRGEHVVRVMDVGQLSDGVPYFVMEYLEGTDLEALLRKEGPFPPDRAVDYVLQACEALAEAHAVSIVHRDIKPENLFLVQGPSRRSIVKVVDFGIAKRLDASRAKIETGPQENMGSPCYMSPEQMSSPRTIDSRTDIWSLGVVLYQFLSGELPFDGDTVVEVFARVANAAPRPLGELRPEIDRQLDGIVRRCLEKNPADRFYSVGELVDALRVYRAAALLRTSPAVAPAPSYLPAVELPDARTPEPRRVRSDAPVAIPSRPPVRVRAVPVAALIAWLVVISGASAIARSREGTSFWRAFARQAHLNASEEGSVEPARWAEPYFVGPFGEISRVPDVPFVAAEPEPEATDDDLDDPVAVAGRSVSDEKPAVPQKSSPASRARPPRRARSRLSMRRPKRRDASRVTGSICDGTAGVR